MIDRFITSGDRMHLPHLTGKFLAIVVGLAFISPAFATLDVRPGHPRLFATPSDLAQLKAQVPLGSGNFPSEIGKISFTLIPVAKAKKDRENANIFGAQTTDDSILIRYIDSAQQPGKVAMQIAFRTGNGTLVVNKLEILNIGEENNIEIEFDTLNKKGRIKVKNSTKDIPLEWVGEWKPTAQPFQFNGHRGDQILNFHLSGTRPEHIWDAAKVDVELSAAWTSLFRSADIHVSNLNRCDPINPLKECNVLSGSRTDITDPARELVLAFYYSDASKKSEYLQAAKTHIDRMLKVDPLAGGEWTMSARVGALGLYYDWMFSDLGASLRPGTSTTYKEAVAELILKTVKSDNTAKPNDDLIYSICGTYNSLKTAPLNCTLPLIYKNWDHRAPGSISDAYVVGHAQSAVFGTLLGLLAVHDERPEVAPLLSIIYQHFKQGFLPARNYISAQGGHQTLFAYATSAGDMADRLVVWKRALQPPKDDGDEEHEELTAPWLSKTIYPYIYGLRNNKTFPATGDAFLENTLDAALLGSMALSSAADGDGNALDFYQNQILPNREMNSGRTIWDRLLYPTAKSSALPPAALKLSAEYGVSGNVLIRNSWDNEQATLLDFKSTSFISEGHQHLDQNSFSLNYKSPLLVDSGQYDDYATTHWKNYYQRTIAHNTIIVYDKDQTFPYQRENQSNDGGQWYGTRKPSPTLEEIKKDGPNALYGITDTEDGNYYVYTTGNASKSYERNLDPTIGFRRSIVYLRWPDTGGRVTPPTVLIFDNVRAKRKATSLLHMATKPVGDTALLRGDTSGRYTFDKNPKAFTVRNGEGMVTIQTLLPEKAAVSLSGGLDEGDQCQQFRQVTSSTNGTIVKVEKEVGADGDCRFLVRNSAGKWLNYPPRKPSAPDDEGAVSMPASSPDIGAWRLEISEAGVPEESTENYRTQYFLNVFHVANYDNNIGVTMPASAAKLVSKKTDTLAVMVNNDHMVIFNAGGGPKTNMLWNTGQFCGNTLVVGIKPNARYTISLVDGTVDMRLSDTGQYLSSAKGVLVLTPGQVPGTCK